MVFDKYRFKRPKMSNLVVCSQGFLAGLLVSLIKTPFHESGHYAGAWIAGARDMKMYYNGILSYEIEHFPNNRRVLFALGGPVADRAYTFFGYYLLRKSNLFLKLCGLGMVCFAMLTPIMTGLFLSNKLEKAYAGDSNYKEFSDEMLIAKHLGITNPLVVFGLESCLDFFIIFKVFKTLPSLPGYKLSKLLTGIFSIIGVFFGWAILYPKYIGPTLFKQEKQGEISHSQ